MRWEQQQQLWEAVASTLTQPARARHRLRPHLYRLPLRGGLLMAFPCLPSCAPSRLLGSKSKREMLNHTPVVSGPLFAPVVGH